MGLGVSLIVYMALRKHIKCVGLCIVRYKWSILLWIFISFLEVVRHSFHKIHETTLPISAIFSGLVNMIRFAMN